MKKVIGCAVVVFLLPPQGIHGEEKQAPPAAAKPATDSVGDPLPPGARTRLGNVRWTHPNAVRCVAFASDGKFLATVTDNAEYTIRLWEVASGKVVRAIPQRCSFVNGFAFSPDGKQLASGGSYLKAVELWDVATGKRVQELPHPDGYGIESLAFAADGQTLATIDYCKDDTPVIHLWDLSAGKERARIIGSKKRRFWSPVFSPDSRTLAAGGRDRRIWLWEAATGKELRSLETPADPDSVAFSPDGRTLASAEDDMNVNLWEAATGKKIRGLRHAAQWNTMGARINTLAFSPNGTLLAAVNGFGNVRLWEVASGKELAKFRAAGASQCSLAFSANSQTLAVAHGNTVILWDVALGKDRLGDDKMTGAAGALAYSPDGQVLAAVCGDNAVRLWDPVSGKLLHRLPGHERRVGQIAYSPDGRMLATADWDIDLDEKGGVTGRETVRVWQTSTGKELYTVPGNCPVAFAPDSRTLVTTSRAELSFWNAGTGKGLRKLTTKHKGQNYTKVGTLAFSPDGTILASGGSGDGTVCLWDVATAKELRRFSVKEHRIAGLTFSPDGKTVAVGAADTGTISLWEVATAKEYRRWAGFQGSLTFSSDGRMLAAAGPAATVCFWEVATGKQRRSLAGHLQGVGGVALSPDGATVASAGYDRTILIWDVFEAGPGVGKLESAWHDLSAEDASTAYRALGSLRAAKERGVALLRQQVQPVPVPDAARLARLLADLESNEFAVRQQAEKGLEALGDLAEPALRQMCAARPALEPMRRAERLLDRLRPGRPLPAEELRAVRAVEALESIAGPEAVALLRELAKGAEGARQTREARATLERLERRWRFIENE